jgi:hypothetical protein
MSASNDASSTETRIELVPADEARGHCPTLKVDGTLWHDPVQPYRPVFALDGARPDVVAVFGLGLGYAAAGALQLNPRARIVAWEPIAEVRELAETLLRDEWQIADRVAVEAEAADFQARLLAACRGARSMASLELPALRQRDPSRAREFRRVVQEVVDADTLTSLPADAGASDPLDVLPQLASHPRLLQVAGPWRGQTALLLADLPDESTRAAIARCHGRCQIVTSARLAPVLARAGLQPDLVVVRDGAPPTEEACSVMSESLVGVSPDSHPAWWTAPAAGRFVLGHSSTAWLLPPGDPGQVLSYRWGPEVPMAVAALTLGARALVPVSFERSPDAHWNWLAPSRRRQRIIHRLSGQTGAEVIDWSGKAEELPEPSERPDLRSTLARAEPIGHASLRGALSRSRRALERLRRETDRMGPALPPRGLAAYAAHRAEADPFTRVHVTLPLADPLERGDEPALNLDPIWDRAAETLDRAEARLGFAAKTVPAAGGSLLSRRPLRVFVGAGKDLAVPTAVLERQIHRQASGPVEIVTLQDALAERFGPRARSLPPAAAKLLVPALCDFEGRALYVEPSVLVFGDVFELNEHDMAGAAALAPLDGPASVLLIDAERADWDPEKVLSAAATNPEALESLLMPSVSRGIGKLDEAWCRCDDPSLEASAVRITCAPWLPWLAAHHPAAWAWEAMLAAAIAERAVTPQDLDAAVAHGALRTELAQAGAPLLSSGVATPAQEVGAEPAPT